MKGDGLMIGRGGDRLCGHLVLVRPSPEFSCGENRPERGPIIRIGLDGVTVGVLTYEQDDDYERGRELIEKGSPLP